MCWRLLSIDGGALRGRANPNPNPTPNPNAAAHCVGETISIHSTLSTERISSMALGRCCLRRGGGSKALWVAKACSSSESLPEVDRWSTGAFRHLCTRTLCLGCEGPSITVLSTYPAIESLISFPTRLSTVSYTHLTLPTNLRV